MDDTFKVGNAGEHRGKSIFYFWVWRAEKTARLSDCVFDFYKKVFLFPYGLHHRTPTFERKWRGTFVTLSNEIWVKSNSNSIKW